MVRQGKSFWSIDDLRNCLEAPSPELCSEIEGAVAGVAVMPDAHCFASWFEGFADGILLKPEFDPSSFRELFSRAVETYRTCLANGHAICPEFVSAPASDRPYLGTAWAAGFTDAMSNFRPLVEDILFDAEVEQELIPIFCWVQSATGEVAIDTASNNDLEQIRGRTLERLPEAIAWLWSAVRSPVNPALLN